MIYNEEQWKVIVNASQHYITARQGYVRNATRFMTQQLIKVYEDATGKQIHHKNLSCAVCTLRIYQTIGKSYFDDLENHQNKNFDDLENHQDKNFDDLENHQDKETKIDDIKEDVDKGIETGKGNEKSKTRNKKKKE